MQYALLIFEAPGAYDALTPGEREQVSADYAALGSDARIVGGAKLQPVHTATTVRVQAGKSLVTDGPFADTKEAFGGYYIVSADDLDAALALAARIPAARLGGAVEVRPLVEPPV